MSKHVSSQERNDLKQTLDRTILWAARVTRRDYDFIRQRIHEALLCGVLENMDLLFDPQFQAKIDRMMLDLRTENLREHLRRWLLEFIYYGRPTLEEFIASLRSPGSKKNAQEEAPSQGARPVSGPL